jgi:hypothetical protein
MFVSLSSLNGGGGGANVLSDGTFRVVNLRPGTYRVALVNDPQACLRSVTQEGKDVEEGLTVTGGGSTAPLDIVVTGHCGTVEATLAASDPPPPPNVTAMLLRKSGEEWVLEKQGFRSGDVPGGAVHFIIRGVRPGDYMLYVWPQDAQIEYASVEYMKQLESYGKPVTVTEDGKVTVTIDKVTEPPKN